MKRLLFLFAVFIIASCTTQLPAQTSEQPGQELPPVPEGVPLPESGQGAEPIEEAPPMPEEKVSAEEPVQPNQDELAEVPFAYPYLGEDEAALTIVYYGDFADGVNSRTHFGTIPALKRDFVQTGKARIVFKPYPLSAEGRLAAEASLCAWEQGSKQFWSYQDVLFRFFHLLERENLINYAQRVPNLNRTALVACFDSGKYANIVKATLDSGQAQEIREVPAFVINERRLSGEIRYDDLKTAVEKELGGSAVTGNFIAIPDGWHLPEFISRLFS